MNKVMLIGNVGIEPEVKYFDADQAVANVRLATTEKSYTLPNGTRIPERTDWHNLVFYRRLAKVVENYVHKGDKLYVEGRIQYRLYDDKRGIQRTAVEIIVDSMEMLTPKSDKDSVMNAAPATSATPIGSATSATPTTPLDAASSVAPASPAAPTTVPF